MKTKWPKISLKSRRFWKIQGWNAIKFIFSENMGFPKPPDGIFEKILSKKCKKKVPSWGFQKYPEGLTRVAPSYNISRTNLC